jgi:uncharacterized protein DUF2784
VITNGEGSTGSVGSACRRRSRGAPRVPGVIPLGGLLVWRWPRVVWAHLTAITIGVASITIGFDCPLTTWEQSLRRRAGQRPYTSGFNDHYLAGHIYPHGYEWAVQAIFAACIVGWYVVVVRHWRGVRQLG